MLGCAIGALAVGPFSGHGKWKIIFGNNFIMLLSCLLSLRPEYKVMLLGRFIYGFSIGIFSVFCPKYIAETVPKEVSGPFGTLNQICISFGI